MRPVPAAINLNHPSNEMEEKLCQNEKDDSSGSSEEQIKEIKKPKKEKVLVSLAKNLPYIVYCLSQVVFLTGFLTTQLFIVPFAEQEVSIFCIKSRVCFSALSFVLCNCFVLLCGRFFLCSISSSTVSVCVLITVCSTLKADG